MKGHDQEITSSTIMEQSQSGLKLPRCIFHKWLHYTLHEDWVQQVLLNAPTTKVTMAKKKERRQRRMRQQWQHGMNSRNCAALLTAGSLTKKTWQFGGSRSSLVNWRHGALERQPYKTNLRHWALAAERQWLLRPSNQSKDGVVAWRQV